MKIIYDSEKPLRERVVFEDDGGIKLHPVPCYQIEIETVTGHRVKFKRWGDIKKRKELREILMESYKCREE